VFNIAFIIVKNSKPHRFFFIIFYMSNEASVLC